MIKQLWIAKSQLDLLGVNTVIIIINKPIPNTDESTRLFWCKKKLFWIIVFSSFRDSVLLNFIKALLFVQWLHLRILFLKCCPFKWWGLGLLKCESINFYLPGSFDFSSFFCHVVLLVEFYILYSFPSQQVSFTVHIIIKIIVINVFLVYCYFLNQFCLKIEFLAHFEWQYPAFLCIQTIISHKESTWRTIKGL